MLRVLLAKLFAEITTPPRIVTLCTSCAHHSRRRKRCLVKNRRVGKRSTACRRDYKERTDTCQ